MIKIISKIKKCKKAKWLSEEALQIAEKSEGAKEKRKDIPRSLDPREGKGDTAATAREESTRACPHWRRGLTPLGSSRSTPRSMSALERIPQVPALTPHKVLGPSIDGRGNPRGPREATE